jgi:hypothetical protein
MVSGTNPEIQWTCVARSSGTLGEREGLDRIALRYEGERVRRINARYAHLTRTASASVKIIAESMGKWRTTEMEAASDADSGTRRSHS